MSEKQNIIKVLAEQIYPKLPAYFKMKHMLPYIDEKYKGYARKIIAHLHKEGKIKEWGVHIWKKSDVEVVE